MRYNNTVIILRNVYCGATNYQQGLYLVDMLGAYDRPAMHLLSTSIVNVYLSVLSAEGIYWTTMATQILQSNDYDHPLNIVYVSVSG